MRRSRKEYVRLFIVVMYAMIETKTKYEEHMNLSVKVIRKLELDKRCDMWEMRKITKESKNKRWGIIMEGIDGC